MPEKGRPINDHKNRKRKVKVFSKTKGVKILLSKRILHKKGRERSAHNNMSIVRT